MKVSIVICTHNRRALLARAIGFINSARRPPEWTVDLVVIANACSDDTMAWLSDYNRNFSDGLTLTFEYEPTPGKSYALNRALARIDADVVAFVDDDHRVAPEWLEAITGAAETHPEILCFCGRILPDWDGTEPGWVHDDGAYRIRPYPVPRFDMGATSCFVSIDGFLPGGGNLFFRRALLDVVGGFDPSLGPRGHNLGGGEDVAFVVSVLLAGLAIRYVPTVLQYHYVDPDRLTWRYIVRKGYQRSRDLRCSTPAPRGRQVGGVPVYLFPQLFRQLWRAAATLDMDRRRHFCVRSAATLGEIHGYRRARRVTAMGGDGRHVKGRS